MSAIAPPPLPRTATAVTATACPRWQTLGITMLLALAVYLPAALGASLLQFDDNFFFGPDNPEFQEGLRAVLDPSRTIANAYLPVAHLSLWLDYAWTGTAPFWPHLHALLLHGLAGFVCVRFLLQLGAGRLLAHAAGAMFVVHPALAESVAWVSGRKDLLCGLFVLLALHQTVIVARRPSGLRMLGIALLAVLAMYSKATAVVLPFLALLVCCCTGGSKARWAAVAVLWAAVLPVAWHHQLIAADQGTLAAGAAADRLAQVPGAFLHYVLTAVWPLHLNVLYPEIDTLARFRGDVVAGTAVLSAWCAAAFVAWWWPRWRLAALGLAGFVVALLPFNTAYPASSIAAADRYLYLAVPWLALALCSAVARVVPRQPAWAAPALLAAIVLPLAWLAGARTHVFADDQTLWQGSIATEPINAVAHLNLVYDRMQHGPAKASELRPHLDAAVAAARYPIHELRARELLARLATMEADYPRAAREARAAVAAAEAQLARETTRQRRDEATVLLLRAQLAAFEPLQLAGDETGAAACHEAAKALAPHDPEVIAFGVMRDLAACGGELRALAAAGNKPVLRDDDPRGAAADAVLKDALAVHGKHAGLWCAQAEWDRARDRAMHALASYRRAQEADPGCVAAWLGAARLLREREQWADAEQYARKGLMQRRDPALRQEFALALVGQGKLSDAELQLEACMKERPDDKDTAKVLANVLALRAYAAMSDGTDRTEIVRLIERSLAYNPDDPKAHFVLGRVAKEEKRYELAVRELEIAHKRMPDFAEAREAYAGALAALGWDRLLRREPDSAVDAWLRCLAVAPPDFDGARIREQLDLAWKRSESTGVEKLQAGDKQGAAAAFRRCLQIAPQQHWAGWLLALTLQDDPAADLAELEQLCRRAIDWQQQHGLDKSKQVLLLATTLVRAGRAGDAKAVANDYLRAPDPDAKDQVLAALRHLAEG